MGLIFFFSFFLVSWTLEDGMRLKNVDHVCVSPSGKEIVCTVSEAKEECWVSHLYLSRDEGKSWNKLIEEPCWGPQWSPDGKWIVFIKQKNLWKIAPDGSGLELLTDVDMQVETFACSPDGSHCVFVKQDHENTSMPGRRFEQNEPYRRLWLVPLKDRAGTHCLTAGKLHVGTDLLQNHISWHPDGARVAFDASETPLADDAASCSIYSVDISTHEILRLPTLAGSATQPFYSPDGKWLAYSCNVHPFRWAMSSSAYLMPAEGGPSQKLASTPNEEVQCYGKIIGWSGDSQKVYVLDADHAHKRIYALPIDGSEAITLALGDRLFGNPTINASCSHMSFAGESLQEPVEAYMTPLTDPKPLRVSQFNSTHTMPLPKTEVVHWESSDGLEIEGLLTYPMHVEEGSLPPLLLIIHGGPMYNFEQCFIGSPFKTPMEHPIAAFASKGFAVLRPNPRGSNSYGRTFRFANYSDWAGKDFEDILSGVDHVLTLGLADPNRLGIMGWSYGGYLTAWAITQTDRFKAASIGAGIANLLSFMGTTDIPSFIADFFGGEITERHDFYLQRSPLTFAGKACTPTLLQYGGSDARVPMSQGQEFYRILKRRGVPVEMFIYPGMAHHTKKPQVLLDLQQHNLDWFEKYLNK